MKKLLIAMQFYPGDRNDAMRISRFIADIETNRRQDVEFCFAARIDAEHDRQTVHHVSGKFKVHIFTSGRRDVGWPNGCNGLWHDLMIWSQMQIRDRHGDWEAVLTTESDACPLSRDWISKLMMEWDNAKAQKKFIVGCKIENGDPNYTHINGNALWDARITGKIQGMTGTPIFKSWDVYHAPKYMPFAYDSPMMKSDHNIEKRKPITEQMLYAPKMPNIVPVFFHGAKSPRAEQIVRAKLKI